MLGEVDRRLAGHWFGAAALSILHISALLFFAVWWMPRNFLFAISRYAPGKVKFALALNFFTGMLLLQLAIQVWWQRTTLLATLYVVLWLAAWLLTADFAPGLAGAGRLSGVRQRLQPHFTPGPLRPLRLSQELQTTSSLWSLFQRDDRSREPSAFWNLFTTRTRRRSPS